MINLWLISNSSSHLYIACIHTQSYSEVEKCRHQNLWRIYFISYHTKWKCYQLTRLKLLKVIIIGLNPYQYVQFDLMAFLFFLRKQRIWKKIEWSIFIFFTRFSIHTFDLQKPSQALLELSFKTLYDPHEKRWIKNRGKAAIMKKNMYQDFLLWW